MRRSVTLSVTRTALLCALAIALSAFESVFTPVLPPGAKAGLSNVIVMLAASVMGLPTTLFIVLVKAAFALLTRGAVAAFLSALGGVCSALVLWTLFRFARPLGVLGISMIGAATHSLAQLLGSYALYGAAIFAYAPVLLLLSLPSGAVTAAVLRAVTLLPISKRKEMNDEGSL